MQGLTLHHCHDARSFRSLWLLYEIGKPFDLVIHDFGKALRSPEYLALHPLGRVPCLIDGPVRLFESGAICEHLCEQYDPGLLWRWPGHEDRADWLNWLHFAETMGQMCANLTQQHIVIRDDADRSPLLMKLEARRLEKALQVVETALDGQSYMLKSGFSAVDTAMGYSVETAARFVRLDALPRVADYVKRLQGRAAHRKAQPPEGVARIYRLPFYPVPDA